MIKGIVSVGGVVVLAFVLLYGGWLLFAVCLRFGKWFNRNIHKRIVR